jgi:hypothetical protein
MARDYRAIKIYRHLLRGREYILEVWFLRVRCSVGLPANLIEIESTVGARR